MNPSKGSRWATDGIRAGLILIFCSIPALVLNALSPHPVPLLSSHGPGALPDRAARIDVLDLEDELRQGVPILVLDVRREEAFAAGHIPQAVPCPYDHFSESWNQLRLRALASAASQVVLYCESEDCPDSDRAARIVAGFGVSKVRVLQGGWRGYTDSVRGRRP